jgi:hypothetical protein
MLLSNTKEILNPTLKEMHFKSKEKEEEKEDTIVFAASHHQGHQSSY